MTLTSTGATTRRRLRPAMALAAAALWSVLPAAAQDNKPEPFTKGTVLVIDHADLASFLTSPKDRAMAGALGMIPARIREVGREAPNIPPEAPGLAIMAINAFSRPGRMIISYNGENPSGGGYGYGAALSFLLPDQAAADQMHARLSAMAAQAGPRIKTGAGTRFSGMSDIQTPLALVSFGPRKAADGIRYEIIGGTLDNPDEAADALPTPKAMGAPAGFEPLVRARLNLAGLNPAMQIAEAFAGQNPEAAKGLAQLRDIGIGGDAAMKISFTAGHTKDESVSMTVVEGARTAAATLGLSDKPLTKANFAAIPSDAIDAYMRNGEEHWGEKLDRLAQEQPQVEDVLDQFHAATGVDLRTDILDALGGTVAAYLSDSTGGGTIGSAVVMVSFKDKSKFASAFGKLTAVANMAADKIPLGPGYIRMTPWKDGDTDLTSLRFPGLPVPLEITFAMTPDWLIVAPTPQAAIAAARQATGKGDAGLAANKAFTQVFAEGRKVTAVSFSDTARNMSIGYPILSMVGSAVSNMVRSPVDPTRDPGMVVPLYNDLRSGVRARVGFTYWRGDDMISESHSDRSTLVNAAGSVGMIAKILPAIAVPGALIGAAQQNRLGSASPLPVEQALIDPIAFFARQAVSPFSPDQTVMVLATILNHTAQPMPEQTTP